MNAGRHVPAVRLVDVRRKPLPCVPATSMTRLSRCLALPAARGSLVCLAGIVLFATVMAATLRARQAPAREVVIPVSGGFLRIAACTDTIVRVSFAKDLAVFARASLSTGPKQCGAGRWSTSRAGGELQIDTAALSVRVDEKTGSVRVLDRDGRPVLAETGRTIEPANVQGEQTSHVRQTWAAQDESLYGLGQHQFGLADIKGYDLDLWQHNATVAIPFLVSSRGYGILWDNTSFTRFGDLREPGFIPAAQLFDASGKAGGLTGSYFAGADFTRLVATRVDPRIDFELPGGTPAPNQKIHPDLPKDGDVSVRWDGEVLAAETGDHIVTTYSNAGIRFWIDGQLLIDRWRQGWLPWTDVARVRFEKGSRHRVRLEWSKDQGVETMRLQWKTPAPAADTSLWSEVGDGVDYYVVYGPALDQVIGGTGGSPGRRR